MTHELELKIMAYLDGELSGYEARQVATQLEQDPAAQTLFAKLQAARQLIQANEPEVAMPEGREFYWSKIERAILRHEPEGQPEIQRISVLRWLQESWVRMVGVGALAVLLGVAVLQPGQSSGRLWGEVENPMAETGTLTFRSESERMTVVWIYDRSSAPDSGGSKDAGAIEFLDELM